MPVFVSMLRGVNVGGHNKIKMEELRALYESLELRHAQTYIQSGNVVFSAKERDTDRLAERIGDGIARRFGFRPGVVVRTSSDLRKAIAKNPFPARAATEPNKLSVTFLAHDPDADARNKALGINVGPEELRIDGRELYIYFPDGQGRSKLTLPLVEKTLKTAGTGRNWNTVVKLLEMAESLETA
jgi:uncharacterized protein (DUF1697 family)